MGVERYDRNYQTPQGIYNNLIGRRAANEFQKVSFGSELEAQSGGSSATFRLSDTSSWVSQILSGSPVSFINRYPGATDEIRTTFGLPVLAEQTDAGFEGVEYQQAGLADTMRGASETYVAVVQKIGLMALALVLVLGGLVIIALSTDTGKAVAKDALMA